MYRITILIVALSVRIASSASVTDSLQNILIDSEGIKRAGLLTNLSDALVYNDTYLALDYASEACSISLSKNNLPLYYKALRAVGYANGYLGNFEVSLQNMSDVFSYYQTEGDSSNMAKSLSDMAYLMQALSRPEGEVMEHNIKALSIREAIDDKPGIAYSMNNIGALYWKWNEYEKAVVYFKKALPYFEMLQLDEEIATLNGNIGAYYVEKDEPDSAMIYLNKALEQYSKLNHLFGKGQTLTNIAKLAFNQSRYDESRKYNIEALKIRSEIGDREGMLTNYYNIGSIDLYFDNLDIAEKNLKKSLQIANEIGIEHKKIQIYETLSDLYVSKEFFREAYNMLQKSKQLNDSVFAIDKHRQLEEIREKYDSEKKEAENQRLQSENEVHKSLVEKNKMLFYLSVAIALLLLTVMYLVLSRKQTRAKLKGVLIEQRLLRAQMNPHFIFNSITAIQNYILSHSAKEAVNYLSNIASLMRMVIDNSRKETIDFESEIKLLNNYFSLQQLRFPGKFSYKIEVANDIDTSVELPPMLIQPFIENSIEHGIKPYESGGEIIVRFKNDVNMLIVEVEDNGVGINTTGNRSDPDHIPFAINATRDRIAALNRKKRLENCFKIIDKNSLNQNLTGTIIKFKIPAVQKY